jgi:hypothetical protein
MVSQDAIDLMKPYAIHGIKDWSKVKDVVRNRARKLLANHLAENEAEAMNAIAVVQGAKRPGMFIPMPNINHKGIVHCFFQPLPAQNDQASFDLLLLCEGNHCLGFRFEPAQLGTHTYPHIQMNRKMLHKELEVPGIPNWVPTSYPAFPLHTSDPLRMFLSMTTSIHGYRKGMSEIVQEAFAQKPAEMKKYLNLLTAHVEA